MGDKDPGHTCVRRDRPRSPRDRSWFGLQRTRKQALLRTRARFRATPRRLQGTHSVRIKLHCQRVCLTGLRGRLNGGNRCDRGARGPVSLYDRLRRCQPARLHTPRGALSAFPHGVFLTGPRCRFDFLALRSAPTPRKGIPRTTRASGGEHMGRGVTVMPPSPRRSAPQAWQLTDRSRAPCAGAPIRRHGILRRRRGAAPAPRARRVPLRGCRRAAAHRRRGRALAGLRDERGAQLSVPRRLWEGAQRRHACAQAA